MDFLFSIFEFLTVAAGPFCVFAGMGKDKNVGKLTFRNIIAADSSIQITENESCITLTSNGSGVAVPNNLVPWGCDTGITWGFLCVDTNKQALTGLCMIGGTNTDFTGSTISSAKVFNNMIILPDSNKILSNAGGEDHIIVNSINSCMNNNTTRRSAIIGGGANISCTSDQSSIIESCQSSNFYGCNSTIISSVGSGNCQTQKSTIVSSYKSQICYIGGVAACNNSVISSLCSCVKHNKTSSIISSNCAKLINCNVLSQVSTSNTIISSFISGISGGQTSGGITLGSKLSSIISDCKSYIFDSFGSTIMSGNCNYICTYTYGGGNIVDANNCFNSILSGGGNKIYQIENDVTTGDIKFSSTISSCQTCIYTSKYSSIISSRSNTLINNSYFSSIIGGKRIGGSKFSNIINSCCSIITLSNFSTNIGGVCQTISEGYYTVNLGGTFNTIRSQSRRGAVLGGCCNTICSSKNSVIFAGTKNCIINSSNNTILGGNRNKIDGSLDNVTNSSILGGQYNCIESITANVIGGVILGGCKNLVDAFTSIIIGGDCNCINNARTYSAIIASEKVSLNHEKSVIVASNNITSTKDNTVTITNLIFDKHVYIGAEPNPYCGRTGKIIPGIAGFKIRNGFVTTA